MAFYWVNLGKTHQEVQQGKFLWAPESFKTNKGTIVRPAHWENVAQVKRGDIIFCSFDQHVHWIAEATQDAYTAERPPSRSFREWNPAGHRIDVRLTPIPEPLYVPTFARTFRTQFGSRTTPTVVNQEDGLNQIYMARLPADAGLYLLDRSELSAIFVPRFVDEGAHGKKVSQTTRDAVVQARVGQGPFRKALLQRWNNQCALTGLSHPELLIASHIEPWSLCDNRARLDPDNGLLLAAHIDRLFDRGLVSFDDQGRLLIGDQISPADQQILGIAPKQKLQALTVGNQQYLARHREMHGFPI